MAALNSLPVITAPSSSRPETPTILTRVSTPPVAAGPAFPAGYEGFAFKIQ